MLPGTRRHASQVELLDYLTDSTWFDFLGLIGKPAMCPVRQQQLLNEAKSVRELAKTFDVHIATVYWLSAAVALSRLSVPLLPKPYVHTLTCQMETRVPCLTRRPDTRRGKLCSRGRRPVRLHGESAVTAPGRR